MVSQTISLSKEQETLIDLALDGHNVLVDACIGSGKTTTIQQLCNMIDRKKSILYLTFNKLLKIEAKSKIKNFNTTVTNYHGFVYPYLRKNGIMTSVDKSIDEFVKRELKIKKYDVLIIDEYQDISESISELLNYIKRCLPNIQIIAVGDMQQKLYDYTTLDVESWINDFMGKHSKVDFTQCFRLSDSYAAKLGEVWNKKIIGVNHNQKVSVMSIDNAIDMIASLQPHETLVLGKNNGKRSEALNRLTELYPDQFNKSSVYSSTQQRDAGVEPSDDTYIFTTYDTSKGMERKYCFIFDYDENHLNIRKSMPDSNPDIINNLFLVAASRGKDEIIFVTDNKKELSLSDFELSSKVGFIEMSEFSADVNKLDFRLYMPESMFNFKYVEHLKNCVELLTLKPINMSDTSTIDIKMHDEKLDLSMSIGLYSTAAFFKDMDIEELMNYYLTTFNKNDYETYFYKKSLKWQLSVKHNGLYEILKAKPFDYSLPFENHEYETNFKHDQKDVQWELLCYNALVNSDKRYVREIVNRYISKDQSQRLINRISELLKTSDPHMSFCQYSEDPSIVGINDMISISGYYGAIHDDILYHLQFVDHLSDNHLLQCAVYMMMTGLKVGRVWNLRTNELVEIQINDEKEFMDRVITCITRGRRTRWNG